MDLFDQGTEEAGVLEELTGKLRDRVEQNLGREPTDPIFASEGAWTCYLGERGAR